MKDSSLQMLHKGGARMNINDFCTVIESSLKSIVDPNYVAKGKLTLSTFKLEHVTNITKEMKKSSLSFLKHIDEKHGTCYLWKDRNNLVGVCAVKPVTANNKDYNWITAIQVNPNYRGYGLGEQILDFCIKKLKGNALTVAIDNQIALNMYKKHGFKISNESLEDVKAGRRKVYFMYH